MAQIVTHIRFALDLADDFVVTDMNRYLSGTIYPDSRYLTRVERQLTHPEDFLSKDFFLQNDFNKGWFVHLLCDHVQNEIIRDQLPNVCSGEVVQYSDEWFRLTAVKLLQNISDAHACELKKYLACFDHVENPNGESIDLLLQYYRLFKTTFIEHAVISIGDDNAVLDQLSGSGVAQRLELQAKQLSTDERFMSVIYGLYHSMLTRAKEILP